MQSTREYRNANPLHVALIMDGNRRWADAHGLPRTEGHRTGARALARVIRAAPRLGIRTLTVFAFSAENWQRSPVEVAGLMEVFRVFFTAAERNYPSRGVRVTMLGRRDRIPLGLLDRVRDAERATRHGRALHLRVAIDHSGRAALHRAAVDLADRPVRDRPTFARLVATEGGGAEPHGEVDLLVRTGGRRRLSDFLLFEIANAEIRFLPALWPDFRPRDLAAALEDAGLRTPPRKVAARGPAPTVEARS
jgi:undecaprenyl diphosphate synthase